MSTIHDLFSNQSSRTINLIFDVFFFFLLYFMMELNFIEREETNKESLLVKK